MKKAILLLMMASLTIMLFGQNTSVSIEATKHLTTRILSGIVEDSAGTTLTGATLILKSRKDSLVTSTNLDGAFIFKGLKKRQYSLTVRSIGYVTQLKKIKIKDSLRKPSILGMKLKPLISDCCDENLLIRPRSIVCKEDTVFYIARFYKVNRKSKLADLLKKMEGMEVANDGSLTLNGQPVLKVKLNGEGFKGGGIEQAINSLPARGVKQIQIIDDYGDAANMASIKGGDPIKLLNIVTHL